MSLLRVTGAFTVWQGGIPRVLAEGDVVEDTDPAVKGREVYFEAVEVAVARDQVRIEQASAAPGERRTRTTPRKRAAAKRTPAKPKATKDKA